MAEPDVELLVAPNPGPMTLEGTNTYLVGRDPTVVIDPGPADEGHVEKVRAAAGERGGIGMVLVTHGHSDHRGGIELLGVTPTEIEDGAAREAIAAMATPGHAADHVCFLLGPEHPATGELGGTVCFAGDLILGEGSTIVPPADQGGSLADYMRSLRRLGELDLALIFPGHGPRVNDPAAKIAEYIDHRESRERRLLEALARGVRSRMELLALVWDDVPAELRPAAAFALQAHLDKLAEEDRLPEGIWE